jgi:DNA-binding response OmpR family regulator
MSPDRVSARPQELQVTTSRAVLMGVTDGPRVLVADDEDDIRALVGVAVRRAGCVLVAAVADGEAALISARTELPDLVVLDVSMPGRTGLDVCAELRQDPGTAGIRVLLLSAGASPDDVARGLAAGADAYLPKPFSVADLVAEIRGLATGHPA